jgi:EAL domain-containing protein (putative c-di-GMP-specific phosphodiesterase class I)
MEIVRNYTAPERLENPNAGDFVRYIDNAGLVVELGYTPPLTADEEARQWRNEELAGTDKWMAVPDHPQFEAYKTYRQKLRDWPSTADFPKTPPTL